MNGMEAGEGTESLGIEVPSSDRDASSRGETPLGEGPGPDRRLSSGVDRGGFPRSGPTEAVAAPARRPVRLLDPHTVNQIAAGEVVERPASVVKELVENALDAGARRIRVELRAAGRRLIQVTDDGEGMDEADARAALRRHATSKIVASEDLLRVATLGFRGEALPSIASVSRFTLTTAREDGRRVVLAVEGGEVREVGYDAGPRGTEVRVEDLFYNTPARLKFLKSDGTELGQAIDHVCRYAVARPDVAFVLVHNGQEAFRTPGDGDRHGALAAVWGREVARALVEIDADLGRREPPRPATGARQGALSVREVRLGLAPGAAGPSGLGRERAGPDDAGSRGPETEALGAGDAGDGRADSAANGGVAEAGSGPHPEADLRGVFRVRGFVSPPHLTKSTRAYQYLFVNGRPVRTRTLTAAVDQAFRDLTPERRFPLLLLMLEVDPARVDVNVSPTKSEVRFQNEGAAFDAIRSAIRGALLRHGMIPDAASVARANAALAAVRATEALGGLAEQGVLGALAEFGGRAPGVSADGAGAGNAGGPHPGLTPYPAPGGASLGHGEFAGEMPRSTPAEGGLATDRVGEAGTGVRLEGRDPHAEGRFRSGPDGVGPSGVGPDGGDPVWAGGAREDGPTAGFAGEWAAGQPPGLAGGLSGGSGGSGSGLAGGLTAGLTAGLGAGLGVGLGAGRGEYLGGGGGSAGGPRSLPYASLLRGLRVVGQALDTFILAETADGLVLIDQHVAHERILYERLCEARGRGPVERQPLLVPQTLELDRRAAVLLRERLDELAAIGFELDPFGGDGFVVRAAPAALRSRDPLRLLRDLVDELVDGVGRRLVPTREQLWITTACKMAVKAGDRLGLAEMERLVVELAQTENPYLCPHGRPITVTLGRDALYRLFKR